VSWPQLRPDQREMLTALLGAYLGRLPDDAAEAENARRSPGTPPAGCTSPGPAAPSPGGLTTTASRARGSWSSTTTPSGIPTTCTPCGATLRAISAATSSPNTMQPAISSQSHIGRGLPRPPKSTGGTDASHIRVTENPLYQHARLLPWAPGRLVDYRHHTATGRSHPGRGGGSTQGPIMQIVIIGRPVPRTRAQSPAQPVSIPLTGCHARADRPRRRERRAGS